MGLRNNISEHLQKSIGISRNDIKELAEIATKVVEKAADIGISITKGTIETAAYSAAKITEKITC